MMKYHCKYIELEVYTLHNILVTTIKELNEFLTIKDNKSYGCRTVH